MKRVVWIDYAKGFAILGVLLLHTQGYLVSGASGAIGAFDMMLFFFLSGYVFSIRKTPLFGGFLWRRLRTLVIPGLVFGMLSLPLQWVLNELTTEYVGLPSNGVKWLLGFVVNLRGREGMGEIPWFLTCLFLMEIGAYVLVRVLDSRECEVPVLVGVAVVISLIGYGYSVLVHKVLPWSGDIAMSLFCFFILGMIMKRLGKGVIDRLLAPVALVPAMLVFAVAVASNAMVFDGEVNAYLNEYGNYVCFIVGAVSGIWMICTLCRAIERVKPLDGIVRRPLTYLGRNTLVIYCVNGLIYPVFIPWLLSGLGLDTGTTVGCALWVVAALMVNLVVCLIVASLVNRFVPELLGRKRS